MASNYPQFPKKNSQTVIIAGLVGVIVILLGVVGFLVFRSHGSNTAADAAATEKTASGEKQKTASVRDDPHLNELRVGLDELNRDMDAYVEGVPEYEAGLIQLEDGKLQLAAGQQELNKGYADYAAGQQQLADGKQTLDDGEAQYAAALQQYNAGVALIQANTQKYEEGKAKLAQLEPLMPYLNAYTNFRNGTVSTLPGFGGATYTNAQTWYTSVVYPLGVSLGLDMPASVTDFPAYMNQQTADCRAEMKEYEEGLAMLEAAKPQLEAARAQLDAGHVAYNEGQAALADGAAQLQEGEAKLADGKEQLAEGELQLSDAEVQLEMYEQKEREMARSLLALLQRTPEVAELLQKEGYLGASFDYDKYTSTYGRLESEDALQFALNDPAFFLWAKDENGNAIILNGQALLDLDACQKVIDAAQEYVNGYEGKGSPWD